MAEVDVLREISRLSLPRDISDFTQPIPKLSFLERIYYSVAAPSVDIVYGLDINRYQDGEVVDAGAVFNAGYRFVIIEAAWGLWSPPTFAKFWPVFLDAGFIVLCYGFFRGDQNGADQADFLLNVVRPCYDAQGIWMPLSADVEPFSNDPSTVKQRQAGLLSWGDVIRSEVSPGAYSNIPSWQNLMGNLALPSYFIEWAAHWADTTNPLVATGWPRRPPEFHQYGVANYGSTTFPWVKSVPGINGDVSVDKFYGTLDQLKSLGKPIEKPEPPVVDIQPVLDAIDAQTVTLLGAINGVKESADRAVELLEGMQGGGGPQPSWRQVNVVRPQGHASAYYISGYNQATPKRPIMSIWPSDQSDPSERVQFDATKNPFDVYPEFVQADGGSHYPRIAEHEYSQYGSDLPSLFFHPNHIEVI